MLPERGREPQIIGLVQDAYRAALLGVAPHPSLLGKVTDRAFRTFVHDLLQLLLPYSVPNSLPQTTHGEPTPISRQHLFAMIAALITNAAPTSDDRLRRSRALRSRKLWTSLLFHDSSPRRRKSGNGQSVLATGTATTLRLCSPSSNTKAMALSPFKGARIVHDLCTVTPSLSTFYVQQRTLPTHNPRFKCSATADAKRNQPGWKARRWVVERTHSWLNRYRKLLVSFEKTAASYVALLSLAAALICWRQTTSIYG